MDLPPCHPAEPALRVRVEKKVVSHPGRDAENCESCKTLKDALYVLSCFNQFDLKNYRPPAASARDDDIEMDMLRSGHLQHLQLWMFIYGILRPVSNTSPEAPVVAAEPLGGDARPALEGAELVNDQYRIQGLDRSTVEQRITKDLLTTLAHQLRMNRRRGVVPILASLGVFLLAYIFSIILAFSDLSESTSVFVLDPALLFS